MNYEMHLHFCSDLEAHFVLLNSCTLQPQKQLSLGVSGVDACVIH